MWVLAARRATPNFIGHMSCGTFEVTACTLFCILAGTLDMDTAFCWYTYMSGCCNACLWCVSCHISIDTHMHVCIRMHWFEHVHLKNTYIIHIYNTNTHTIYIYIYICIHTYKYIHVYTTTHRCVSSQLALGRVCSCFCAKCVVILYCQGLSSFAPTYIARMKGGIKPRVRHLGNTRQISLMKKMRCTCVFMLGLFCI